MKRVRLTIWLLCVACRTSADDPAEVEAAITREIARGVEATRTKDIDGYMAQIPEQTVIYDEAGGLVTRNQQRANVLRDWSIIDRTLAIDVKIDSLVARDDSARVFTSQRWARMMYRRDGVTLDTVVTTQKHREVWSRTPQGWRNFRTDELGGTVIINGQPYSPPSGPKLNGPSDR
jgi:hypothetical protein